MSTESIINRAVIGAGLMGHGIAQVLATIPGTVWLYDISVSALDEALARIDNTLTMLVRHGLMDESNSNDILGRIHVTTDLDTAVGKSNFIIEAVPENLELKQSIFSDIAKIVNVDAVLATNSSSFQIGQIASSVENAERVVGSHFFLPAQIMPLVEVSRGSFTSEETMIHTVELWQSCGKEPIRVEHDIPGYVANRLQAALTREAVSLVARGVASVEDIDTAFRLSIGLRSVVSGPLEQRDITGLDLHVDISRQLWPDLDQSKEPHQYVLNKLKKGDLGLKTGHGFYDWTGKDPEMVRSTKNDMLLSLLSNLARLTSSSLKIKPGVESIDK